MLFRQLEADLRYVFDHFATENLTHFRDNLHRLVRHAYQSKNSGCIMFLLSETLPAKQRIESKASLKRFFAPPGGSDEHPDYQPPRWIVRLWDEQICDRVRARYGENPQLTVEFLRDVLDRVLAERRDVEQEALAADRSADRTLAIPG